MAVKYFRHFSTYPLLFHVMISSSTETLADYSATASLFVSQPEPSSVPSPSSFSSDDAQPSTSTGSEKYDFRCYICGYCSNMRARFSYHMNSHTGTKPFQCKICLQSFTQPQNLYVHRKTHSPPEFKCDFCPKMFTLKGSRDAHMNVHIRARPFKCEQCHQGFSSRSGLIQHRWKHCAPK